MIDVIDRVPRLQTKAAHLKERMKNAIIENLAYARTQGIDRAEITELGVAVVRRGLTRQAEQRRRAHMP